jgi:hypothetical protein
MLTALHAGDIRAQNWLNLTTESKNENSSMYGTLYLFDCDLILGSGRRELQFDDRILDCQ